MTCCEVYIHVEEQDITSARFLDMSNVLGNIKLSATTTLPGRLTLPEVMYARTPTLLGREESGMWSQVGGVVLPALQCGQHNIATCEVIQGALHETRACNRPLLE